MLLLLAATVLLPSVAQAQSVRASVQGIQRQGYQRVLFNWPEPVSISPSLSGNTLTIGFSKPVDLSVFPLLQGLRGNVVNASMASNGRFIRIQLKQPVTLRPFNSGTSSGVDLLPASASNAATSTQAASPPPSRSRIQLNNRSLTTEPQAIDARTPPTRPTNTPTANSRVTVNQPSHPSLQRALPRFKPAAPPAPPAKDHSLPSQSASSSTPAATPTSPSASSTTSPSPTPAPRSGTSVMDVQSESLPPPSSKTATISGPPLTPTYNREGTTQTLGFNWPQPVGSAVYTAHGRSWLVFAGKAQVQTQRLNTSLSQGLANLVQRPSEDYTVLTLENPKNIPPSVRLEGSRWLVSFQPDTAPLIRPIALTITEGGQRLIPIKKFDDPITHPDPRTGNRLAFVPTSLPGFGVTQPRTFPDANLPTTQQGVVLELLMDDVDLQPRPNGIQIYSPYSLHLSEEARQTKNLLQNDFLETGTFFPANRWRSKLETEDTPPPTKDADPKAKAPPKPNPFVKTEERLLKAMTKAKPEDIAAYRLQLAKLYMAEDLYPEALAMLGWLKKSEPIITRQHQLDALMGMAHFMRGDYGKALSAFNSPDLVKTPELSYWQMLTRIAMGNWNAQVNLSSRNADLLNNYPPKMQQRIAFLLADAFIEQNNVSRALSMLQRLDANGTTEGAEKRMQLYFGRMAEKSGQIGKAIAYWQSLTEQFEDAYARAHALFYSAQAQYLRKMTPPEDVAQMLEKVRTIWRNNDIEKETLRILGQIYIDNGQYADGLRTWKDLIATYGQTETGQKISQRMHDTFERLFNQGEADQLEPLEALALYYEFSYLTPTDHKGDEMIQKLADRLTAFDLLDRAAAMLKHQVQYRLAGDERDRVSTRLTLLHVLNRKYKEALQTLNATDHTSMSPELMRQRNQLRALAHARLGEYTQALAALEGDDSVEGQQVRLEILWRMEDWPRTAGYLESLLPQEVPETRPLPEAQAQNILRLAIAQQFANNPEGLYTTRERYERAMRQSPYARHFNFLTAPDVTPTYTNMQEIGDVLKGFGDYVDTLKQSLQKTGLSGSA